MREKVIIFLKFDELIPISAKISAQREIYKKEKTIKKIKSHVEIHDYGPARCKLSSAGLHDEQ